MKTVSGKVLSSKPVSLSKAARVLSKFVASDNGASPAFAAYLRRASAAFDELVQLRKEMKGSVGDRRDKKHIPDDIVTEETVNSVKKQGHEGERKLGVSDKRKHKRNEVEVRKIECDESAGIRTGKRNGESNVSSNIEDRDAVDVNGNRDDIDDGKESVTKSKKKRSHEEKEKESGIKVEIEEADKKESRKRKHKGSGHGRLHDSEEQHRSKKKSRKHEVDD